VILEELQTDWNDIQKEVAQTASRVGEKVVRACIATTNAMPTNFEVGGYILVGVVQRQILPKLVSWQRPVSATDYEIKQVLGVENRLRGQSNGVYCTTGNLCQDASLGASEELKWFQQYQASTFLCLRSVCTCQRSMENCKQKLNVHCVGFGKVENNWEPVELIADHVPDMCKRVCS
jgi:hypothetical protein